MEVLFAGLAPGLIGVYQVDLRMPAVVPAAGDTILACRIGDAFASARIPTAP
jgi:uncharacterized protein (TIGR03437 family)